MARVIIADAVDAEVVPGLVRRAREAADLLLKDAQAQASDLLLRAQQQADLLITNARIEAGLQARQEATQVLLEASAARDRALADARAQVIAVGVAAAEKILGASLSANPALIEDVVRPLLARVRRARRLELRLHPDDAQTLSPRLGVLESESGVGCPIRLEHDATLRRGSCILVSDLGVLDARLETRLELVARALEPLLALPDDSGALPSG